MAATKAQIADRTKAETHRQIRSGIIRFREVQAQTGLKKTMLYALMKEGLFPRPVRLGGSRCVGWLRCDVDAWVARQIAQNQSLKKDRPEASNKAVA